MRVYTMAQPRLMEADGSKVEGSAAQPSATTPLKPTIAGRRAFSAPSSRSSSCCHVVQQCWPSGHKPPTASSHPGGFGHRSSRSRTRSTVPHSSEPPGAVCKISSSKPCRLLLLQRSSKRCSCSCMVGWIENKST
jgi:hypothetical protein